MGASGSTSAATPTCEVLHGAPSWSSLHETSGHDYHHHGTHSPYAKSDIGHHHHQTSTMPTPKKKRSNLTSLATLKKRLVRRARRVSKTFDHGQILRDFLTGWSTRDLLLLVEEYEATGLLKDLSFQAEIARPSASTVSRDLAELYDLKYVADTYLIFRGVHFPVHKAIICVRCPYFRELLGKVNTFGARVPISLDIAGLRPELFNDLIRYLYSGELSPTLSPIDGSTGTPLPLPSYESVLLRLSEQFGVPNDLDYDLKRLLETGLYSDASLVFSPAGSTDHLTSGHSHASSTHVVKKCRACSDQAEYSCHTAVLASRSPFFKNVIQRHQRRFTEQLSGSSSGPQTGTTAPPPVTINTANQKIRIVLDEQIIPRRFARVILHAMYRDSTDLMAVLPLCVCKCYTVPIHDCGHSSCPTTSSSNQSCPSSSTCTGGSTTSIGSCSTMTGGGSISSLVSGSSTPGHHGGGQSAGNCPTNLTQEIMDLFEIARFLELDSLIQSCEDMMMDALSVDTLVPILKWSEQAHGSPWVKRQAIHYLKEEFATICTSSALYSLDASHLMEAVRSDYLQASELEVLVAVVKWAEHRLVRRMEERGEFRL